jgi:3-methyladenine DNA glycosylase AlkC
MIAKLEARVLAGNEQVRRLAESGEGMSDGTELDGLRARSYDERNTILAQLPPWLRPAVCRRSGTS